LSSAHSGRGEQMTFFLVYQIVILNKYVKNVLKKTTTSTTKLINGFGADFPSING